MKRFHLHVLMAMTPDGIYAKYGGGLPWPKMPADMHEFVRKTNGKVVVMGRRTFESLPLRAVRRMRLIVVLTRKETITGLPGNALICNDPEDIRLRVDAHLDQFDGADRPFPKDPRYTPTFVFIGGGEALRDVADYVAEWDFTLIEHTPQAGDENVEVSEDTLRQIGFPVRAIPWMMRGTKLQSADTVGRDGERVVKYDPLPSVRVNSLRWPSSYLSQIPDHTPSAWMVGALLTLMFVAYLAEQYAVMWGIAIAWAVHAEGRVRTLQRLAEASQESAMMQKKLADVLRGTIAIQNFCARPIRVVRARDAESISVIRAREGQPIHIFDPNNVARMEIHSTAEQKE